MAQRRDLAASTRMTITSTLDLGSSEAKEPGPIPLCPADKGSDFGEAGEGLAVVGEAALQDQDPVGYAIPGTHKFGARLYPPRQFHATGGLLPRCIDALITQVACRCNQTPITPFADPM